MGEAELSSLGAKRGGTKVKDAPVPFLGKERRASERASERRVSCCTQRQIRMRVESRSLLQAAAAVLGRLEEVLYMTCAFSFIYDDEWDLH